MDPFDCYETCVQSPAHVARFLRAVHGNQPAVLREDFCGTAAVARRWCLDAQRRGEPARAICTDLDADTIAKARSLCQRDGVSEHIRLIQADALAHHTADRSAEDTDACDIVFIGNFSIGYIQERAALVRYLELCRNRLGRGNGGFGGGIIALDTYGGAGAWKLGSLTRKHPSRGREIVHYHWAHEEADPLIGAVVNSISFRVELDGEIVTEWPRAFVYRWRLWSIHELREALTEAGFAATEVYQELPTTPTQTPRQAESLGEDWVVLIIGRT